MGILEIVLLLIGGAIFVAGFVIPVKKEEVSEETKTLAKKEIEDMVAKEMEGIRSHVDDVVGEAVEYSMEKTERSLERLSNEKIMAVNEYSDTVLQEIHKNHEEVMFLYDMLNDKHTNLKNTVTEVNRTVKEVEETKKEAEAVVNSFQKLAPESPVVEYTKKPKKKTETHTEEVTAKGTSDTEDVPDKAEKTDKQDTADQAMDISFVNNGTDDAGRNCNERILELRRQGKSKVAIAKELGLGVGEVKLVIDLYQNM